MIKKTRLGLNIPRIKKCLIVAGREILLLKDTDPVSPILDIYVNLKTIFNSFSNTNLVV